MLHIIGPIEQVERSYIIILPRYLVATSICSCTSYKTVAIYTRSYTEPYVGFINFNDFNKNTWLLISYKLAG